MTKERVCFHVLLRKGWIGRARKGELIKHSGKFEHYKSEKSKRPLSAIPSSEAAQERQRSFSPRSHPRKVTLGGQPCSRPHTHTLHVRRHRLVPNFIRLERAVAACQISNTPACTSSALRLKYSSCTSPAVLSCTTYALITSSAPLLHTYALTLSPVRHVPQPLAATTPHKAQLTNPYARYLNPNNPSVPHPDKVRILLSIPASNPPLPRYLRSSPSECTHKSAHRSVLVVVVELHYLSVGRSRSIYLVLDLVLNLGFYYGTVCGTHPEPT
jgi:hypothetical protein